MNGDFQYANLHKITLLLTPNTAYYKFVPKLARFRALTRILFRVCKIRVVLSKY